MSQWLDYVRYGNGHDGSPAVSGTINSYATMIGTSGNTTVTTSLSVSIGDVVLCHQSQGTGAGNWQLVTVKTTGSGSFTANEALAYTYGTGAQAVLVPQYTGGTLSGAVTGTAWNGTVGGIIALMSNGDLTISGSLAINGVNSTSYSVAGARAGRGTGGGFFGGNAYCADNTDGFSNQGEGTVGAGTTVRTANGNGGGGAGLNPGGNQSGSGGGGGNGTAGGNGTGQVPGTGGSEAGNAGLTNMVFGGGGGGGEGRYSSSFSGGASGAGIILIFSKNLTLSGTLSLNGGASADASIDGGGGAGGSCLIKAQTATLGTNKITASGGYGNAGGAGGAGRIHVDYSDTITGTTTPTLNSTQVSTLKSQTYSSMI